MIPTMRTPDNTDDIIDSRDVIARIAELVDELDDDDLTDDERADIRNELESLQALADEGEGSPDWPYGETLIRDSYFVTYAQELADDIGAIDAQAIWPLCHIDWEAAAESLKQDYTELDFDGVTYWIRS